jgi:hypothetical protein
MDLTYIPMARGFVYLCAVVGLVQPEGLIVEAVDPDGSGFLHRSGGGSACPLW